MKYFVPFYNNFTAPSYTAPSYTAPYSYQFVSVPPPPLVPLQQYNGAIQMLVTEYLKRIAAEEKHARATQHCARFATKLARAQEHCKNFANRFRSAETACSLLLSEVNEYEGSAQFDDSGQVVEDDDEIDG